LRKSERVLREGSEGPDVRTLQSILDARGYGELETSGTFDPATTAAVRGFQQEAGLQTDGVVGPETRPKLVALMRVRRATWYGPGLYGNKTACGQVLTKDLVGVAHKSLPCGTMVEIAYGGRSVVVPVVDRGPFVKGMTWDITSAAAEQLGFTETARIGALVQPAPAP